MEYHTEEKDHGILTVGKLRELTAHLPDDIQVVIARADWYANVEGVTSPNPRPEVDELDDSEWSCLTFFPKVVMFEGSDFDSRQL